VLLGILGCAWCDRCGDLVHVDSRDSDHGRPEAPTGLRPPQERVPVAVDSMRRPTCSPQRTRRRWRRENLTCRMPRTPLLRSEGTLRAPRGVRFDGGTVILRATRAARVREANTSAAASKSTCDRNPFVKAVEARRRLRSARWCYRASQRWNESPNTSHQASAKSEAHVSLA